MAIPAAEYNENVLKGIEKIPDINEMNVRTVGKIRPIKHIMAP